MPYIPLTDVMKKRIINNTSNKQDKSDNTVIKQQTVEGWYIIKIIKIN